MNPGCALDALVAEKVMGCTALVRQEWSWSNSGGDVDSDKGINYWCECGMHGSREKGIKNYSTEIADAWGVVEKMRSLRHPVRIFSDQTHKGNLWVVQYVEREFGTMTGMSAEESLPHAICLAALKALGVDVSTAPASPSQTP